MINLLPTQEKKEILAGRSNHLLIRYLFLFIALGVVMLLVLAGVYLYLSNTKNISQETIESNEVDSRELVVKQQEVDAFKSDLATAKQILDKQVNYSEIILKAAAIIPSGVVLDSLTLDPETIGTATTLSAQAKSEQAAINLKNALNNSPYFADAHFESISRGSGAYPYTVALNVTFTQELLDD